MKGEDLLGFFEKQRVLGRLNEKMCQTWTINMP